MWYLLSHFRNPTNVRSLSFLRYSLSASFLPFFCTHPVNTGEGEVGMAKAASEYPIPVNSVIGQGKSA